jgi:hypothetical protein
MTSSEKIARRARGISRLRLRLSARVRASVEGPRLDSELAEGISPSASPAHLARADRITRPRVRRQIAAALNRAIEESFAPARRLTPQVPLSVTAIRECREQLITLARRIVNTENPRVQGVAIASQLAFDGRGALFFQPKEKSSSERLANTIQAAMNALRVSGDFDRMVEPLDRIPA